MASPSRDRLQPVQRRAHHLTWSAPPGGQRRPPGRRSVGRYADARARPANYRGRRPSASSRFCAPFEGGCRGSINGSKRRLSRKKERQKRAANTARKWARRASEDPRSGRTMAKKPESSRTPKGPCPCPSTVSEKQKSQNPYIFCRKLQFILTQRLFWANKLIEKQRLRVLGGLKRQFPGKCWFKLRIGLKHAVLARFRQENGRKTAILLLLRMVPNCELLTATMANAGTAGEAPCSLAWTGPRSGRSSKSVESSWSRCAIYLTIRLAGPNRFAKFAPYLLFFFPLSSENTAWKCHAM